MYIDPRITESTPTVPIFADIKRGQAFIYDGDLYIALSGFAAVRLSDGVFYEEEEIPCEAAVTPVSVKIVPEYE